MTTCPDCGCRVYEYGCINCNEQDYIDMQDYDDRVITDEPKEPPSRRADAAESEPRR